MTVECPLCVENIDDQENFWPCPCLYRVCAFCYCRLRSDNNQCPGCRSPYDGNNHAPPASTWQQQQQNPSPKSHAPPPPPPKVHPRPTGHIAIVPRRPPADRHIDRPADRPAEASTTTSSTPRTAPTPPSPVNDSVIVGYSSQGQHLGRCTVRLDPGERHAEPAAVELCRGLQEAVHRGSMSSAQAARSLVQLLREGKNGQRQQQQQQQQASGLPGLDYSTGYRQF